MRIGVQLVTCTCKTEPRGRVGAGGGGLSVYFAAHFCSSNSDVDSSFDTGSDSDCSDSSDNEL